MTPVPDEPPDPILEAATWWLTAPVVPGEAAIPRIRERFGLTAQQACRALAEAARMRRTSSA